MKSAFTSVSLVLLALLFLASSVLAQAPAPEFMSLESAKPVLQKMGPGNGNHPDANVNSKDWSAWLQKSDADIRQRLDTGEEDTSLICCASALRSPRNIRSTTSIWCAMDRAVW